MAVLPGSADMNSLTLIPEVHELGDFRIFHLNLRVSVGDIPSLNVLHVPSRDSIDDAGR